VSPGILKPSEKSSEETTKRLQRLSTYLFSLPSEKIVALVDAFVESKTSFSVSHVSDRLDIPIEGAYDLHYFFLFTLHQHRRHDVSTEAMEKEFKAAGFDSVKVKHYVDKISTLDDDSKQLAEVLFWAPQVVEDKFHVKGLGFTISYEPIEGEGIPPNLVPIVKLTISLAMKDETKDIDAYIPIIHVGRLAKSIEELQQRAEKGIGEFKSHLANDIIVPDGG